MNRAKLDIKKRKKVENQIEAFLENFHYMGGGELAGKVIEYQRIKGIAEQNGNKKLVEHCNQMISLLKKKIKEKKVNS